MLHIWMEQNVLFYGMIGAGILGILCMFMVARFYGRAIRCTQDNRTERKMDKRIFEPVPDASDERAGDQ